MVIYIYIYITSDIALVVFPCCDFDRISYLHLPVTTRRIMLAKCYIEICGMNSLIIYLWLTKSQLIRFIDPG